MKNPALLIPLLLPLLSQAWSAEPRTVVVLAPHPDDAEASCGGFIANAAKAGDRVVILTMTGGELGIGGKTPDEARAIRAVEAKNAAAVLGATVEFFGAIDGALAVDASSAGKLTEILLRLSPAIVLAPWPLDVHTDHQASGLLAWRVFQDRRFNFALYFYETSNSPHTKTFQFVPTDYVDITDVMKQKRQALYEQKSQAPADWWQMYEHMAIVNGYAADVRYAEAYIKARNFSGMGGRPGATSKTLPSQR